jgi:flagellar hook-associated protein 2
MSVTFTGLASGIDSAALIDQLVAVEKQPAVLLGRKVSDLNRQGSIVDDIVSKLRAFGDRARGLDLASEVRSVKADRSDTSHVGVAVSGTATMSTHSLRVTDTARSQSVTSRTFTSDAAGVLGDGSVTIDTAAGDPVTVAWTAADSLSTIAARINDANAAANASVIFDGTSYRLVATARQTGTVAAPTFIESGDALGWSVPTNITAAARDAAFVIDGISVTRGTNVVSDVLAGVTLTLTAPHAVADPDTVITIADDRDAMRDKVKGLVDTYNTVAGAVDGQLRYTGVTKGADTLFGDSTLRGLQGALGRLATDEHAGKTLAGLGIRIDTSGRLTLDQSKFDAALTADPAAVEALFVGGGLAKKIADLADLYTRSGDGILTTKGKVIDERTAGYQKDIARIEAAASATGDRLRAQFTALEQAISTMRTQSNQMLSILGQLG